MPNVSDVGAWLQVEARNVKVFGQECRPVPLKVEVRSYRSAKNEFLFQEPYWAYMDLYGLFSMGQRSVSQPYPT